MAPFSQQLTELILDAGNTLGEIMILDIRDEEEYTRYLEMLNIISLLLFSRTHHPLDVLCEDKLNHLTLLHPKPPLSHECPALFGERNPPDCSSHFPGSNSLLTCLKFRDPRSPCLVN